MRPNTLFILEILLKLDLINSFRKYIYIFFFRMSRGYKLAQLALEERTQYDEVESFVVNEDGSLITIEGSSVGHRSSENPLFLQFLIVF